MHLGSMNVTLL